MNINPIVIEGGWKYGWALDYHTTMSRRIGYDEKGYAMFDTTRTEMGECLYKLKYKLDRSMIAPIARMVADFIRSRSEWKDLRAVIPAPPSNTSRPFQPVFVVAASIGSMLNIEVPTDYLVKTKPTTALKGIDDTELRSKELEGAFEIKDGRYTGCHVLLFDDLYRSGETLNTIASILLEKGKVAPLSILTVTKTRVRR